ncbi:hypothetical protein QTP88_029510 [Uroleucon formosanum]
MTSRARDKFRKYKSGNEKKKIKQNKEKYLKLQQGSFERFLKDDKDNKIEKVGATSSTSNVNLPEIVEQNIVESELVYYCKFCKFKIEIVDATSDVNLPEIVEQNIVESEVGCILTY